MQSARVQDDVRTVLTLFAGFVTGMHLAVFLHELGHALGYWLGGGTVSRIIMESPLPAGRVLGSAPNAYMPVWGGIAFGTAISVAPLLTARWLPRESTARFVALMTAAFCLGHNGMYLFVGGLMPFADASNIIALGTPRLLLTLLGIPLLVGFVLILSTAIRCIGLSVQQPFWQWLLLIEIGLWSFPGLMAASMLFMPVPKAVRLPTLTFVACYAACFAIAAWCARRTMPATLDASGGASLSRSWSIPAAPLITAFVLVTIEWLVFGPS